MILRAVPYEVPFRRPIRTAHGTLESRAGFWILAAEAQVAAGTAPTRLDPAGPGLSGLGLSGLGLSGLGLLGLGEIAPLPGWGSESPAEAAAALTRLPALARDLAASDRDLSALPDRLAAAGFDRDRLPATTAGLELALLDLAARARGLSLAELLALPGTTPHPAVGLNALLAADAPVALALEARRRVAEGYRTLKLKVGATSLATDIRRVQAVREAVGPAIRLRLDANAAWDRAAAREALAALQTFDLEYVEQPVPDAGDFAALRPHGQVPLAADESALDARLIEDLIAARAADVIVLKPMAIGGLLRARDLALSAQAAGIGVTVTSVLDRGVGIAGALHLAAALRLSSAAGLSTMHLDSAHVVGPRAESGQRLVTGPGLGIDPSEILGAPSGETQTAPGSAASSMEPRP